MAKTIKFKKVKPSEDEVYQVAFDDKCVVIKQGENKIWISKSMIEWMSLNFKKLT